MPGAAEASFGITVGRSFLSGRRHVQPTKQSRGGLLVRGLEGATADLIFFDRQEEGAEITLAKTLVASVRSGRTETSMPFSANAAAYSDRPSFVSQSVISCIAAHARLNSTLVDPLGGRFLPRGIV